MLRNLTLGLMLAIFANTGLSQVAYIDDKLLVPLRSGEGTGFRIIHKGLKSGVKLEVIKESKESGYSFVKTPSGLEGYIPTRYLSKQPIAAAQLVNANKTIESLREKNKLLTNEFNQLSSDHKSLQGTQNSTDDTLKKTESELRKIKEISANAIHLDQRNHELRENNEQLRNEVELLQVENKRLKDRSESNMMLIGGGLVLLGVIIALLAPALKPTKKSDGWA